MKRKINIEYQSLVFLYAYLRQIDLSLDRSRWTTWTELKEYYRPKISPEKVANHLLLNFNLTFNDDDFLYFVKAPSFFKKIKYFLFKLFYKKYYLSDLDVLHCVKLLFTFDGYLKSNLDAYNLDIEKLRIDIAKFNSYVLEDKLWRKDLDKAMKVEHYLQNETLTVISIEEFSRGVVS